MEHLRIDTKEKARRRNQKNRPDKKSSTTTTAVLTNWTVELGAFILLCFLSPESPAGPSWYSADVVRGVDRVRKCVRVSVRL